MCIYIYVRNIYMYIYKHPFIHIESFSDLVCVYMYVCVHSCHILKVSNLNRFLFIIQKNLQNLLPPIFPHGKICHLSPPSNKGTLLVPLLHPLFHGLRCIHRLSWPLATKKLEIQGMGATALLEAHATCWWWWWRMRRWITIDNDAGNLQVDLIWLDLTWLL